MIEKTWRIGLILNPIPLCLNPQIKATACNLVLLLVDNKVSVPVVDDSIGGNLARICNDFRIVDTLWK
jgi:hypothetical protein